MLTLAIPVPRLAIAIALPRLRINQREMITMTTIEPISVSPTTTYSNSLSR